MEKYEITLSAAYPAGSLIIILILIRQPLSAAYPGGKRVMKHVRCVKRSLSRLSGGKRDQPS